MLLKELCALVDGEFVTGESRIEESVEYAFASDLMSDVLTVKATHFILITGLSNLQSIRTAEMSDVHFILIARGKKVTEEMIELAEENDMVLITTKYSVFKTAGILYGAGLKPVY